MSIYSGFATRQQEEAYDSLAEDLVYVLQKRLLKFYHNEQADESKFISILSHIYASLLKMEDSKYLEPKLSRSFEDLLRFLTNKGVKELRTIDRSHVSPIKHASTTPFKPKGKFNHFDSLAALHEETSIGKIIRQLPDERSLTESRRTPVQGLEKAERSLDRSNIGQRKQGADNHRLPSYLEKPAKQRTYRKRQTKSKAYCSRDQR